MRKISTREVEEPVLRRGKSSQSPTMEAGSLGRTVPHAPVTSQSWSRSYTQQPQVGQTTLGFYISLLIQEESREEYK